MTNHANITIPKINLPKGGGAISGIGESFQTDVFTGTAGLSIPIHTTSCRGFEPELSLKYNSGAGNGPFGLGFDLSISSISRKVDKRYPKYDSSDKFQLTSAGELVPKLKHTNREWVPVSRQSDDHLVISYRPRTETQFASIEKWVSGKDGSQHWKVTTKDNVTSIYGESRDFRIAGPTNPAKIFKWLLQESYDALGNRIVYQYLPAEENDQTTSGDERAYCENRCISSIKYGEYTNDNKNQCWHFELVFDYGERQLDEPEKLDVETALKPDERTDPFSSFRSGFEIRTLRLCQGVLLFHRFGSDPQFLVHSTLFKYVECDGLNQLKTVTQSGHRKTKGELNSRSMPPLVLTYAPPVGAAEFRPLTAISENGKRNDLRIEIDELVDLFGDGLPGIFRHDQNGAYYARPMGDGCYQALQILSNFPIEKTGGDANYTLSDLNGDGNLDLLVRSPGGNGYFKGCDGTFEPYSAFPTYPTEAFEEDRHIIDVTGDGLADLVFFEAGTTKVTQSLGYSGFSLPACRNNEVALPFSRERSPVEHVGFADMFGDGGNHIVRVHSGMVECWPHLGYGQYGNPVIIDNAPQFPGGLDPSRLFFSDLNGTGTADLIYVAHEHLEIYRNDNGKSFKDKEIKPLPIGYDNLDKVRFADILGTGTACMVITSREADLQLHHDFCDFNGGRKPHVLTGISNSMGAEKKIHYAPSTMFYLEDLAAGKPWRSRLSFPVQVVRSIEIIDQIAGTTIVTSYAYRNGYFDPVEREFCGFGYVEQWDAESFDDYKTKSADRKFWLKSTGGQKPVAHDSYVAPVFTKTWYHTGSGNEAAQNLNGKAPQKEFGVPGSADRYFQLDADSGRLAESGLDESSAKIATPKELGEVQRALRGHELREETYGWDEVKRTADGSPYLVREHNYRVRLFQPFADQAHPVCYPYPDQEISWHYEKNLSDPRVEHTFSLDVDNHGNVLNACHVHYPRRKPHHDEQSAAKTVASVHRFINLDADSGCDPKHHLLGVPCEEREFELTLKTPSRSPLYSASDLTSILKDALAGNPGGWRLLSWKQHFYWDETATKKCPFGKVGSNALSHHSEEAVFADLEVKNIYGGRVTDALLKGDNAAYVHRDSFWWAPELTLHYYGKSAFFLPSKTVDPLGNETIAKYDTANLEIVSIKDPDGNTTESLLDPYTLTPFRMVHINDNKSEVVFDPLGMVVAHSIHGCCDHKPLGDHALWHVDDKAPNQTESKKFVQSFEDCSGASIKEIIAEPTTYLQEATNYFFYQPSFEKGVPPHEVTLSRTTHIGGQGKRLKPPYGNATPVSDIEIHITYLDGFGRHLQSKTLASKGSAFLRDESGKLRRGKNCKLLKDTADPRWLTSGGTIYNNKGEPVKQYEPYYSDRAEAEGEQELMEFGATKITRYDPLLRIVQITNADGTFSRVTFDPWTETHYDENDTDGYELHLISSDSRRSFAAVLGEPTAVIDQSGGHLRFKLFDAGGELIAGVSEDAVAASQDDNLSKLKSLLGKPWPKKVPAEKSKQIVELVCQIVGQPKTVSEFFDTPQTRLLDTQGRVFQTMDRLENGQTITTRHVLDILGREVSTIDGRGICSFKHTYDLTGTLLWSFSADAGQRWILHNVLGNPIQIWDQRKFHTTLNYDKAHRLLNIHVEGGDGPHPMPVQIVEKIEYGGVDDATRAAHKANNQCGKIISHYDQAGLTTFSGYDLTGLAFSSTRCLRKDVENEANWTSGSENEQLQEDKPHQENSFTSSWLHDAVGRLVRQTYPNGDILNFHYLPEGWLKSLELSKCDAAEHSPEAFVTNIVYNAKGQRCEAQLGNQTVTHITYDERNFRLIQLHTTDDTDGLSDGTVSAGKEGIAETLRTGSKDRGAQRSLQDLHYVLDPVGNVVEVRDDAEKTLYFDGDVVSASAKYRYDALYRLKDAGGREQRTTSAPLPGQIAGGDGQFPRFSAKTIVSYLQSYSYDKGTNLLGIHHQYPNQEAAAWTRTFAVTEPTSNPEEPSGTGSKGNNRLVTVTDSADGKAAEKFNHDEHGNITSMPHLSVLQWDYRDQLRLTEKTADEESKTTKDSLKSWMVYDANGQRARKVKTVGPSHIRQNETLYFGGYDVYREFETDGKTIRSERTTLHVMDDHQRVALVETQTVAKPQSAEPKPFNSAVAEQEQTFREKVSKESVRYQLVNHLGSVCLELDRDGKVASYEEYTPYGSSSCFAISDASDMRKRYRYSGEELDELSGLYYYGARYYAPWLGRWLNPDPAGTIAGLNLYSFLVGNPISHTDVGGMVPIKPNSGNYTSRLRKRKKFSYSAQMTAPRGGPRRNPNVRYPESALKIVYDNLPAGSVHRLMISRRTRPSMGGHLTTRMKIRAMKTKGGVFKHSSARTRKALAIIKNPKLGLSALKVSRNHILADSSTQAILIEASHKYKASPAHKGAMRGFLHTMAGRKEGDTAFSEFETAHNVQAPNFKSALMRKTVKIASLGKNNIRFGDADLNEMILHGFDPEVASHGTWSSGSQAIHDSVVHLHNAGLISAETRKAVLSQSENRKTGEKLSSSRQD